MEQFNRIDDLPSFLQSCLFLIMYILRKKYLQELLVMEFIYSQI